MKNKKSTLSWAAYLFGHLVLLAALIYGLNWDPIFAAVFTYLLVILRIGSPRTT